MITPIFAPSQPIKTAPLSITAFKSDAIEILPGDLSKGIILMCEHASNAIPPQYHDLGLSKKQLERHIAYDIGVEAITRHLSILLNVPAIMTRYSRLLIDPNRALDDPTLIMQLSDGAVIEGNAYISDQETQHRIEHYYQPYHDALKNLIDTALSQDTVPMLLSLHSFTERWKMMTRPWEIGILWDKDSRLPNLFLQALSKILPSHAIGNNEPYSGRLIKDSMYYHGTMRGLAHALIEVRQDLITEAGGQKKWGECIAEILTNIQASPDLSTTLNTQQYFGSHISEI